MQKLFKIFFLILPLFLFSETIPTTPIKLLTKEATASNTKVSEQTNIIDDGTFSAEEQINAQNKMLDEIIDSINKESYLATLSDKSFYDNEINFLINRINANNFQKNSLAIKRDELKIAFLKEKYNYETTLKDIILGKREFKNKRYFQELLQKNLEKLNDFKLDEYSLIYENEVKNKENKISEEYVDNYIQLYNQKHTQQFVLQYLYSNIQKFRASNFLIDEFNLKYLMNKIDNLNGISFISSLTSYHLNFSIGELSVVLFIMLFFRLLNRYLINIITNLLSKLFALYRGI